MTLRRSVKPVYLRERTQPALRACCGMVRFSALCGKAHNCLLASFVSWRDCQSAWTNRRPLNRSTTVDCNGRKVAKFSSLKKIARKRGKPLLSRLSGAGFKFDQVISRGVAISSVRILLECLNITVSRERAPNRRGNFDLVFRVIHSTKSPFRLHRSPTKF